MRRTASISKSDTEAAFAWSPATADSNGTVLSPQGALIAFVLIALGFWLRLFLLDQQGLWYDEGVGLYFSDCQSAADCVGRMMAARTSERFQLTYPLLLHWWRDAFGSSETALRSLSVLFSVAAIPLIWTTALRVFDQRHAAWTLALAATSALVVFHSQEARPYTLFLLVAAAQLLLFDIAREETDRPMARTGFYLLTAFASWVGVFPLMFSVALSIADLLARPRLKAWFLWWLPAGLLCVPAVAYYAVGVIDTPPDEVGVPKSDTPFLNLAFVIYGQLVGQTFGPPVEALKGPERWLALQAHWPLLALLAITAGATALRFGQLAVQGRLLEPGETRARFLVYAGATFLVISFVFAIVTRHNWLPRHAIALHPLLALTLPLILRPTRPGGSSRLGAALLAVLCCLNLVSLAHHYFDQAHWKDDYRGVAQYLTGPGATRPAVLLHGLPILLRYYGDDHTIDGRFLPRNNLAAAITNVTKGRPEVLIVVNRELDLGPSGWVERAMEPGYRLIGEKSFPYFTVYSYARR